MREKHQIYQKINMAFNKSEYSDYVSDNSSESLLFKSILKTETKGKTEIEYIFFIFLVVGNLTIPSPHWMIKIMEGNRTSEKSLILNHFMPSIQSHPYPIPN